MPKNYNELTFKERFIHRIHDELIFNCTIELKQNEFHTCKDCKLRVNTILMHLTFELGEIRQQKI